MFIYLWLCWVFVSVRGLSLIAASGGHSSSRCAGLSLSRPLLLRSTGSRRAGSVIVAHGPICSAACGIFPDQGSNPCPLHWQADSQPLRHQGSPGLMFYRNLFSTKWEIAEKLIVSDLFICFYVCFELKSIKNFVATKKEYSSLQYSGNQSNKQKSFLGKLPWFFSPSPWVTSSP